MYKTNNEVQNLAAKIFEANPKKPLSDEKKKLNNDALYRVYF
jgi:hypothetical protein